MALYELFNLIAQSGAGNIGNAALVTLQIYISLFFQVKFLFAELKKKPPLVAFSVSMLPLLFIATYSIASGIIFSAFLDKSATVVVMKRLIDITLTKSCLRQMLLAVAVFFVLMLLYSVVYRLRLHQWLLTFGMETLAALSLLGLYGGLFFPGFPYTILNLCERDIYLARWPIYGYFVILFKCVVLLVALLLGLLLREKTPKEEVEEEKYFDRSAYYRKKVHRFLTKNDRITGIALFLFGTFAVVFIAFATIRDKDSVWDVSGIVSVAVISAGMLLIAVLGLWMIARTINPRFLRSYRDLLAMGDEETVLRLFCEEMIENCPVERKQAQGNTEYWTRHFCLRRQGVRTWVRQTGEPFES